MHLLKTEEDYGSRLLKGHIEVPVVLKAVRVCSALTSVSGVCL